MVNKFDKLLKYQAQQFLNGTIPSLHEETKVSVEDLAQINLLGILTTDSQQGRIIKGTIPKDRKLFDNIYRSKYKAFNKKWEELWQIVADSDEESKKWYKNYDLALEKLYSDVLKDYKQRGGTIKRNGIRSKERPYLIGFMVNKKAHKLSDNLNKLDGIVSWVVDKNAPKGEIFIPVTYINFESGDKRFHNTDQKLLVSTVLGYPSSLSEYVTTCDKLSEIWGDADEKKYSEIFIIDTMYGRIANSPNGLFKKIIDTLS